MKNKDENDWGDLTMIKAYRIYSTKNNGMDKNNKISIRTQLLAFYLFLAPLDFLSVVPGVSLARILIFLPLVGSLIYLKYVKIRIDRFFAVPLFYLIIITLTSYYSYDVAFTQQRIITIVLNITVILILSMFTYNHRELALIKKSFAFSGWLTVVLMLFYADRNIIGGERLTIAINGVYQDPNYLTGFFIFPIIYYLDDFTKKKNKLSIIKMIVFLVFVLLTGSRGGLMAIIVSILFYSLMRMKDVKKRFSSIAILSVLISILGLIFNFVLNMMPESVANRYDIAFTLRDGGADRWEIWESVINNYRQSPIFNQIFGWGAGTIRYFTYNGNVAHNIWVESLMEIGIFGVFILFVFYLLYFKKSYNLGAYVVASSFLGYMIMGLSMSLYSYKPIWNILLLIIILKNSGFKKDTLQTDK
ncbi:O-antigen ligase family protein [Neobacillus piezotolerans]|uniref:O-antigen ligase family protein n=1 Tax=Neobacillus piezotolerans TaxID=2259171 RepID=UPI0015F1768F|nr:O-antigen ligase family protein [Neobacillus piezotolerans]